MTRRSLRYAADDPAPPSREAQMEGTMFDWPERRAEVAEQRALPLGGSTEARFEAWVMSAEGAAAFSVFFDILIQDLKAGERISAKFCWEAMRRRTHVKANNSFHALALRRAEDLYPPLRGHAEKRKRGAA